MHRTGDARGQSAVLAVAMLLGLVLVGSVAIFVMGSQSVGETREVAHEERVENSFRALDDEVDAVAFGGADAGRLSMGLSAGEGAISSPDAGRIVIETAGGEAVNRTMGAVVYEDDERTVAYQAGGVWRGSGRNTVMISAPPISYRDGTLTLPIPVVRSEGRLAGDDIRVEHNGTISPLADPRIVQHSLVRVEITSDYYAGWAQFFRQRVDDVAVSVDHGSRTVVVELGRPSVDGSFEHAVLATGTDGDLEVGTRGNAVIDGPAAAEGSITEPRGASGEITGPATEFVDPERPPLDAAIRSMLDAAPNRSSVTTLDVDDGGPTTLSAGTYYDPDGLTLDDQFLEVDLSAGNVTIYVEGDVAAVRSRLQVVDGAGPAALRIYASGNYTQKNAFVASLRAGTHAEDVQIYGTSEMLIGIGGGGTTYYEGVIYAPREDQVLAPGEPNPAHATSSSVCDGFELCVATGNPEVVGALVGGRAGIQQSAEVRYDPDLDATSPIVPPGGDTVLPPRITYLNVVVHEVDVSDDDG